MTFDSDRYRKRPMYRYTTGAAGMLEQMKRVMAHYAVEADVIGKHTALAMPYGEKPEPRYERFLCLNGEFEGRGLIVPMPATYVWGYDLLKLKDGTHVAVQKEPMATPGLTA